MRQNLEAAGGLVMAERLSFLLAEHLGRQEAHDLLGAVTEQVGREEGSFKEALLANDTVRAHLSPDQIDQALDPATYLGSTQAFIDRALQDSPPLPRRERGVGG
jgi:adenylosuccinate lyase